MRNSLLLLFSVCMVRLERATDETVDVEQDHCSESDGRMLFHAFGSFAISEQSERFQLPTSASDF